MAGAVDWIRLLDVTGAFILHKMDPTTSQGPPQPQSPPKVCRIIVEEKVARPPTEPSEELLNLLDLPREPSEEPSLLDLFETPLRRKESSVSDFPHFPVDESYTPKALKVEKEGLIHEIGQKVLFFCFCFNLTNKKCSYFLQNFDEKNF